MPDSPNTSGSLLSEIISASIGKEDNPPKNNEIPSKEGSTSSNMTPTGGGGNEGNNQPKKKREPINPVTFFKGIGAIFLVAVIFFGSFLAYIVFHPEQAQFFVTTFGIDPRNVADILRKLIYGSFGVVFFILSITWVVVLFRAIWTPKELKRRKILSWISAIFIGIILFVFIAFWAYLFEILKTIDFVNLDGKISIYNNELLNNPVTKDIALVTDTTNIIGPITLTFEIGANAAQIEKSAFININSYEINFDGAICNDGTSISKGFDPKNVKGIVCTFDAVKSYKIHGIYNGTDRSGRISEIPLSISPIEIRGLLGIKKQKNRNNEDIITLDATELKDLGNPRWFYEGNNTEITATSITEKVTDVPQIIEFKLFSEKVDRIFIIERIQEQGFTGSINAIQNIANPLRYKFSLEGLNIDETGIISINWTLNDGSRICTDMDIGASACEYTFTKYGSYMVTAHIETANKQTYIIEHPIKIKAPLIVLQKARIKNEEGTILNTDDTYDIKLRSYIIKDIITPTKVFFDARDVVTEDPEYRLSNVIWTLSDGKKTEQKEGLQQDFELSSPIRYTVSIDYIFKPSVGGTKEDERISKDIVIFDIEHRALVPRFSLQIPSDYVPVVITIDGSQSNSENGEIKKFTYNFGEGKPSVEGDAIQQYEYKESGEKDITLTITNDKGESASIKKTIVLKNNPKIVDFIPSISPGVAGMPVDFTPNNAEGDISDYIWSFGDNTPTIKESIPSHIYKTPGKYIVTLTIVYSDGTRKETRKEVEIISEIQ